MFWGFEMVFIEVSVCSQDLLPGWAALFSPASSVLHTGLFQLDFSSSFRQHCEEMCGLWETVARKIRLTHA